MNIRRNLKENIVTLTLVSKNLLMRSKSGVQIISIIHILSGVVMTERSSTVGYINISRLL